MTERLTTDDFVPPEKRGHHPDDHVDAAPVDHHPDALGDDAPRTDDVPAHGGVGDDVAVDRDAAYDEQADFGREPAGDTGFDRDPEVVPAAEPATGQSSRSDDEPLFGDAEADDLQTRWRALQTDFVDDPQDAVQRADELVAQVIGSLANTFAEHRRSLEEQWKQEGHADTEELRVALRRYRTFFDRLLSV
ncbi:hypothetical protein AB0I60_34220 [Actinosynnema sp. NPDC050436]|uniref:hypothetical protein n=1 Tax=Actinosynnema sp. NPDC050436 TaxID=3155659 RepID=UPI0033C9D838